MSDHADTIRRALAYPADDHHSRCSLVRSSGDMACDCYAAESNAAHVALDALLAERQQAQEERDAWKQTAKNVDAERQQAIEALRAECTAAEKRAKFSTGEGYTYDQGCIDTARAALAQLGEQPK